MRTTCDLVQEEVTLTRMKNVNKGCFQAHRQNPKHKQENSFAGGYLKILNLCYFSVLELIMLLEGETRPERCPVKISSFLVTNSMDSCK